MMDGNSMVGHIARGSDTVGYKTTTSTHLKGKRSIHGGHNNQHR